MPSLMRAAVAVATCAAIALGSATAASALPRPVAGASDVYWLDASLDCYPPSGRLGGGPTNTDVVLGIQWHLRTGTSVVARHFALFEEYRNGRGPYWSTASGRYQSTSGYYGPYHITPAGVPEWSQQLFNFDGTYTDVFSPWTRGRSFPVRGGTRVRAWVGRQLYNPSAGTWNPVVWHLAKALTYRVGDGAGFCGV